MQKLIWGEENFGFYYGQLVANGNGRYYDSQLSFNESKTRFHGKTFAWGRNCHCEVNGKQLKIITEPNVQGQLVLKLPSLFRAYLHEEERL
jgi:acetyl-CoA synthetase